MVNAETDCLLVVLLHADSSEEVGVALGVVHRYEVLERGVRVASIAVGVVPLRTGLLFGRGVLFCDVI